MDKNCQQTMCTKENRLWHCITIWISILIFFYFYFDIKKNIKIAHNGIWGANLLFHQGIIATVSLDLQLTQSIKSVNSYTHTNHNLGSRELCIYSKNVETNIFYKWHYYPAMLYFYKLTLVMQDFWR